MSNINVTLELCPDDRKRLDELIGFIPFLVDGLQKRAAQPTQNTTNAPTPAREETPKTEHPSDAVSPHGDWTPGGGDPDQEFAGRVEEPAKPEAPKYTKADIQARVQKLAAPTMPESKRQGAKAIVKSYGAKVSDIPEEKYPEVMARLDELEKEG